ncbi:division/cell wall cluster transcriptional repressor MraZ [soil metagenome]
MFLGAHDRSLDPKGRVVLPADHREELGESGYVTKALSKCLAIFKPDEFQEVMADLEKYARQSPERRRQVTAVTAGAQRVVPDKQGRIPIPADLRAYARLNGDVKVVGGNTRIEIWDPQLYREAHPEAHAEVFDIADAGLAALGL